MNLESRQKRQHSGFSTRSSARARSPDRLRLNGMGTLSGAALGIAMILLLEWRDTSLKNDDDVRVATGLPVLAFVPFLVTRVDRQRSRRRRIIAGVATAVAVVVVAVAAFWVIGA